MSQPRLTGPGAGSDKYDILTALSVAALASGGSLQVSLLRLMALVTARYNWTQDELSLGQREMAALWSVDERTAKREVKRLLDCGLLLLLRQGVKGRVARYRLDLAAIRSLTETHWSKVGSDYLERMTQRHAPPPVAARVVQVDFSARHRLPDIEGATPWERIRQRLQSADPARFTAWFAALQLTGQEGRTLLLTAPSRFAAQYVATHLRRPLEAAVLAELGPGLRCEIAAAP